MSKNKYRVAVYNKFAGCGHIAEGPTRRKAFDRAMGKAGEPFLREGGDKATTLRTLFAEDIMAPRNRSVPHVRVSHPIGCSVELWRIR